MSSSSTAARPADHDLQPQVPLAQVQSADGGTNGVASVASPMAAEGGSRPFPASPKRPSVLGLLGMA